MASKEKMLTRQGSVSENFFAVNHASLILPKRGSALEPVRNMKSLQFGGDLKAHLYAIIRVIRPQDQIKLVARLESWVETHIRYLVIVTTVGRQDTEESVILGIDFVEAKKDECAIGFVTPIWNDVTVDLNGEGGFDLKAPSRNRSFMFKPVSVQAMWSALHTLNHCIHTAQRHNHFNGSLFLTWTCYYESRIQSSRIFINEWEHEPDVIERRPNYFFIKDKEREATEAKIRGSLKQVMMSMDLDNCTCADVRSELERTIDVDLEEFKNFVRDEMVVLLQQMDTASKIFDFLYLGSAWNAADGEELKRNGITHILNITVIIDNYFPDGITYKNIRLYDEDDSQLLPLWNDTYHFIKRAVRQGGKCLVHCRMGISRSSATVTAFVMKEMQWSMEEALNYVRERRPIISPNPGFLEQLKEYEGILKASSQRHNALFRSLSESNLTVDQATPNKEEEKSRQNSTFLGGRFDYHRHLLDITTGSQRQKLKRSKSWSAGDSKLEDDDDDIIHAELFGDEITEPSSEPQSVSLKSPTVDRDMEMTEFGKYGSKKKKKFKRRHTERVFAWQSSEVDAGIRSGESLTVNSDCGVPTHRFSWDKSSVDSCDSNEPYAPFSATVRHSSDRSKKLAGVQDAFATHHDSRFQTSLVPVIDEVFETDGAVITDQPSVKNLVNSIESKYFNKTHSRQSSKDFVDTGTSPPSDQMESKIPRVPSVPVIDNQNSNNNSLPDAVSDSDVKMKSAVSDDAVVLPRLQGNDDNAKSREQHSLTKDQLRIIQQVGMTFTGEIAPTASDLLIESDSETCSSTGDNGKVRKGLVRRMARAIEKHNEQSIQRDKVHAIKAVAENSGEFETKSADLRPVGANEKMSHNHDTSHSKSGSSDVPPVREAVSSQSHLPHILSFVAPTPYHQFQKSFMTGKSMKKSLSFERGRYKRGVTRSKSERSGTSKMQPAYKDAVEFMDYTSLTEPKMENSDSARDGSEGSCESAVRSSNGQQNSVDVTWNLKLNRIDRQNLLYKSI